jgi:hypothetical protein
MIPKDCKRLTMGEAELRHGHRHSATAYATKTTCLD